MTRDDLNRLRALPEEASPVPWNDQGHVLAPGDSELLFAAVNALPALLVAAERGLDDGLAFGPWNRLESSTPTRHAVAADGWPYSVGLMEDGRWYFHPASGDTGVRDTESAAIQAARAHDRARRAKGE